MNVVVLINGREAVPVRALPFVVPSQMSPDVIVTLMGRADECGRFDELFAYQLPPHGCPVRVQPSEWSRIAYKIMAFRDRIKREEESGAITKSIGSDRWKDDSIRLLPASVFVWKDEFISEHFRDYIQGQVSEDEYKEGGYDPNFEPLIDPPELCDLVMKGFATNDEPREDVADKPPSVASLQPTERSAPETEPATEEVDATAPPTEQEHMETPAERRENHDMAAERGCRRLILENWPSIEKLHGPSAKGRQVLRVLTRALSSDNGQEPTPTLKTVQNRLIDLRREGLIPG